MNIANRRATARPAVGIYFPQRPLLKLDTHAYTPRVLLKILQANGEVKSHEGAARVLQDLHTRLEAFGPYPGTSKPPPTEPCGPATNDHEAEQ